MTGELEVRQRVEGDHVADLVAAYVANNHVASSDLPALIATIHATLAGLAKGQTAAAQEPDATATPARVSKSITRDALISFLDGKPYKSLKRHLTARGLDPHAYRKKYGLPADYPMVAPSYSEKRSSLSRSLNAKKPKQL